MIQTQLNILKFIQTLQNYPVFDYVVDVFA